MKLRILLIVFILLNVLPVGAQEDGDDEATLISRTEAFIALPSTIRFDVWIDVPLDQIQTVTLYLFQEDGIDRRLRLREDELLFDLENQVVYEYAWDEPDDVMLFQSLVYRFEVTTIDGEEDSSEEEIIVEYQDAGEWQSVGNELLSLYWASEQYGARSQLQDLNKVLDLVQAHITVESPVKFVLLEPGTEFCEEIVNAETGETEHVLFYFDKQLPCNPDAMFDLYRASGFVPIVPDNISYLTVNNQLTTELITTIYRRYWGEAEVPAWFAAGMPQFYQLNAQPRALTRVKQASQERRLLTLAEMSREPVAAQAALWSAQAYMLTLYIADVFGADAPFQIATALGETGDFTEALATVTDTSMQRIYRGWTIWLDAPRAAEVVLWHPYLPTTPTPTVTPSLTSIPPSRTPRPTATITLTPTERPLFVATTPAPNYVHHAVASRVFRYTCSVHTRFSR